MYGVVITRRLHDTECMV